MLTRTGPTRSPRHSRIPLVALCSALTVQPAIAASPYTVSPALDITLGAIGGTATVAGMLLRDVTIPPDHLVDLARVPLVDRPLMAPFSSPLDLAGDFALAAGVAFPIVTLFGRDLAEAATILVMYAQTMALAQGTKELLKSALPRYRPYLYLDPPPELLVDPDRYASLPSGHATMTFASAAFLASVFSAYRPDSPWRIPVAVAGFALAGTTAALRMAAGQHFLTDVVAGAALGSLWGFVVPLMHRSRRMPATTKTAVHFSVGVR